MYRTSGKIFLACALGAFIGSLVALQFGEHRWWAGLIGFFTGGLVGYLSYEFRDVRKAIPIALRAAGRGSVNVWESAIAKARAWLSEPHPFFYPAMVMVTPFSLWATYHLFLLKIPFSWIAALIVLGSLELLVVIIIPLIALFAFIGARVGEQCYWWPFLLENAGSKDVALMLDEKGFRRESPTYRNVARWVAKGLYITILFFLWTLWKEFAIEVWVALCFFSRFAWDLFKLIHSEERLLCGVDAAIGAGIGYLAGNAIIGALAGGIFGVLNYEIISIRILKLKPNRIIG